MRVQGFECDGCHVNAHQNSFDIPNGWVALKLDVGNYEHVWHYCGKCKASNIPIELIKIVVNKEGRCESKRKD